jgi:hypothetical protein
MVSVINLFWREIKWTMPMEHTWSFVNIKIVYLFEKKACMGARLYGLWIFQAIMDTWTRQMGFPLITISREGNTITATQKRFILTVNVSSETEQSNNESISQFGYKWYVPLSYYTNQDTGNVHHIWMNMSDGKYICKLSSFPFLCNLHECTKIL